MLCFSSHCVLHFAWDERGVGAASDFRCCFFPSMDLLNRRLARHSSHRVIEEARDFRGQKGFIIVQSEM